GVPRQKRGAGLRVSIALLFPGEETIYTAEAEKRGIIGDEPVNPKEGYPFRSLFYVPEIGKYYSEMTLEEEAQLAHRKDAIEKFVRREVGLKQKFNFAPRDYIELGEKLDLIDTERAGKVSGSRFGYLKHEGPLLEFALVQFAINFVRDEKNIAAIIKEKK